MTTFFNRPTEKQLRRYLRASMPDCEVILWSRLKNHQLANCRFRRQYSVGAYVIDLYAAEVKLGIELDGSSHFSPEQREHDRTRDRFIASFGIRLLRILNSEVRENLDGVLERLGWEIEKRRAEKSASGKLLGGVARLYEMS